MKPKILIASAILSMGTIGTITAFAATNLNSNLTAQSSTQAATTPVQTMHHGHRGEWLGKGIAGYLGLNQKTLRTDLQAGQSLAQIAAAQGKTEQDVINYIESSAKAKLDKQVQNGKLSQVQETKRLAKMDSHVKGFVEHKGVLAKSPGQPTLLQRSGGLHGVAKALKITPQTLRADLKNGQTILQVAQGKGVSESMLTSQLQSNLKGRLDKLVAAGKMTAAKEQIMLNDFNSHVGQWLTRKFDQHKALSTVTTTSPS